jgi:hypothetical protein
MQLPYAYALLAIPPKVLGRQLMPLTLGHCWILDTLQSPIIKGGSINLDDILLAVIICSLPWLEALDIIQYDKLESKALELGSSVIESDIEQAKQQLLKYVSYYATCPERQDNKSDRLGVVVPWYFCLCISLLRLGFSEEKAWSCEVGKALCYQAAASYMDGDKGLLSDYQIEQLERDPEDAKREALENLRKEKELKHVKTRPIS